MVNWHFCLHTLEEQRAHDGKIPNSFFVKFLLQIAFIFTIVADKSYENNFTTGYPKKKNNNLFRININFILMAVRFFFYLQTMFR